MSLAHANWKGYHEKMGGKEFSFLSTSVDFAHKITIMKDA